MRALRELFRRGTAERRLVMQALVAVPAVRLALWLLPFRIVRRRVGRAAARRAEPTTPQPAVRAEQIVWAVMAVSARVPRATCLTQALAASLLLPRYGHDATLRVGVAKDEAGRLRAHAWLESGGVTILGEPEPGAFQPLPPVALS
ncbi:MAG TPA: lasso peptide biosynthesis B2 protein [Thermoanaerobaculia bacterium]